jgi:ribonucleotide monophosphatase NagD (HAD superfamily)
MPAGRHEIEELLQRSETFIFDCDGVLYTYSDEQLIDSRSLTARAQVVQSEGCAV